MLDLGGYTVIVTGFARTGTSMMMRVLRFAGISVISDDHMLKGTSKFDPYGTHEIGNVNALFDNKDTANRAVKVICPFASYIPTDRPVKAIFMQRDLNEVVTSLIALKTIWEDDIPESIRWAREFLGKHKIPTLFVNYKDAINYPKSTISRIAEFLDIEVDPEKVSKAIDKDARTRYKKDKSLKGSDMPERILRMDVEAFPEIVETSIVDRKQGEL